MSQVEEFRRIPVVQIVFSQTTAQKERRAHFDKVALSDLAKSVASIGIMQPIVVRQVEGAESFEVCAGERRVLAAKEAGLADIPAMVREISDEQLLELQLIENLQREGLHELAEAEGYEQLMQKYGMEVDEIVAKVGKSRSYIYGRLKLTALCKAARDAFYEGGISASTALELARIPVDSLQVQALKEISKPDYQGDAMSVREAREHIQTKYMLRLADAGFATDDPKLVPKAGACGACPKRTGNQPELFGDVKGTDVCTDPICFKSKVSAHAAGLISDAKKTGQKVITGAKAVEKVAPYGIRSSLSGYVRLEDKSFEHDQKSYAQVLGTDYVPTLLQDPETGAVIKIAPRSDVPKPKRSSSGSGSSGSGTSSSSARKDAEKEKQKQELERLCRKAIFQTAMAAAPKKLDRPTIEKLVVGELDASMGHDKDFYDLMGWSGFKGTIDAKLKTLSEAQLSQLAAVASVVGDASSDYSSIGDLNAVAKRYGVDVKKVRDRVAAELKAKATPAPAAKVEGKAKTPAKAKGKVASKKKTGKK